MLRWLWWWFARVTTNTGKECDGFNDEREEGVMVFWSCNELLRGIGWSDYGGGGEWF